MGLAHPTWVEASYASRTDRVEVCCLSLLGRLAVDPMRLGCLNESTRLAESRILDPTRQNSVAAGDRCTDARLDDAAFCFLPAWVDHQNHHRRNCSPRVKLMAACVRMGAAALVSALLSSAVGGTLASSCNVKLETKLSSSACTGGGGSAAQMMRGGDGSFGCFEGNNSVSCRRWHPPTVAAPPFPSPLLLLF